MSFYEPLRLSRRSAIAAASGLTLALASTRVEAAPRRAPPWLGVSLGSGPAGGVIVEVVFRTSPAEAAGLKSGDMVLRAGGVELHRPAELVAQVKQRQPGDALKLEVRRGGREIAVTVKLAAHPGDEEVVRRMHVGNRAADLPGLAAVQGPVFSSMKDVRGDVVLVEFFASWCAGCKAQVPMLSAWHQKLTPRGLRALAVTAEDRDEARHVIAAWKLPYAVASDVDSKSHRAYHVSGIPALYLVDRAGIVREAVVGYRPAQRAPLETLIEALLAEKK
jgi:peroxiredoxin